MGVAVCLVALEVLLTLARLAEDGFLALAGFALVTLEVAALELALAFVALALAGLAVLALDLADVALADVAFGGAAFGEVARFREAAVALVDADDDALRLVDRLALMGVVRC